MFVIILSILIQLEAEILKCIKALKNKKCSGIDQIINGYLKHSADKMMPIYISLFNLILETGIRQSHG